MTASISSSSFARLEFAHHERPSRRGSPTPRNPKRLRHKSPSNSASSNSANARPATSRAGRRWPRWGLPRRWIASIGIILGLSIATCSTSFIPRSISFGAARTFSFAARLASVRQPSPRTSASARSSEVTPSVSARYLPRSRICCVRNPFPPRSGACDATPLPISWFSTSSGTCRATAALPIFSFTS